MTPRLHAPRLVPSAATLAISLSALLGCSPATDVTEAQWEAACAGAPRERLERFRALTLQAARFREDASTVTAMEGWHPRGREGAPAARAVPAEIRSEVLAVVRDATDRCGGAETLDLTAELIAFQTVSAIDDNPELDRMGERVEEWADDAGLAHAVAGDGLVWEIALPGTTPVRTALVTHADVVPVNDPPARIEPGDVPPGWTFAPFEASIVEGRLRGRGAVDDKIAIAASLVALAALADAGVTPTTSLTLLVGLDEETTGRGLEAYLADAPPIAHAISVDASYPVIVAEHGFGSWNARVPLGEASGAGARVVDIAAGSDLSVVPRTAEMTLLPGDGTTREALLTEVQRAVESALARVRALHPSQSADAIIASAEAIDAEGSPAVRVQVEGIGAHSSRPEEGVSAIWLLAAIGDELVLAANGASGTLQFIADAFLGDHYGETLGVAFSDPFQGPFTLTPATLELRSGIVLFDVNVRRPRGRTDEEMASLFQTITDAALVHAPGLTAIGRARPPHVVDSAHPVVSTLSDVYGDVTGQPAPEPQATRGSTFARLFESGVTFGPSPAGEPYSGHAADESIAVEAGHLNVVAMLEVLLRLGVEAPSP